MLNDKLAALLRDDSISDIHIREGLAIGHRSPEGIRVPDDEVVGHDDVKAFLAGLPGGEHLLARMQKEGEIKTIARIGDLRMRVQAFYWGGSRKLGIVMRRVRGNIPSFEELLLPASLKAWITAPHGLILVNGPVRSGKSTTLAAIVDHLNHSRAGHFVTLEDPIEYEHKSKKSIVTGVEVGTDVDSFAQGVKAALREDIDGIVIGEIRDRDTAEAALGAAETGHIVFGTLHTGSCRQTVDRFVDFFPTSDRDSVRPVLANNLVGVINQILLPHRTDRRKYVLVYEMMVVTDEIRSLIRANKIEQIENSMRLAGRPDMRLLNRSLLELVVSNTIAPQDAMRASYDSVKLGEEFKLKGIAA